MAKSEFEKAIEKQNKENKKIAEKEARENRKRLETEMRQKTAANIVSGQPFVGGMRIMDASSEEVLHIILSLYDGNDGREVIGNEEVFPSAYQGNLSSEFEKLKQYGMLVQSSCWINGSWRVVLSRQGITYFEDKEQAKIKEEQTQKAKIQIGNIFADGSNLILGDVIESNLSVENTIHKIEHDIDERGEEDSEELRDILSEVKEWIDNIQDSRYVPKNKGLFKKLSNHMEKHGWFYGEVIGLIGSAVLKMTMG